MKIPYDRNNSVEYLATSPIPSIYYFLTQSYWILIITEISAIDEVQAQMFREYYTLS
jgi:hypothetical protein